MVVVTEGVNPWYHFSISQREKKDNPNRGNVNPRKIRTRKDEWEKMKMGKEFEEQKDNLSNAG